jgi:uncharacterized membrane protein YoaT (DUF817 family)
MTKSRRLLTELLLELVAFAVLVTSVVLLWRNNLVLLIVACIECVIGLALWHERRDLSFFLVIAVLGSMAEAVFVRFGVWRYANPTCLGVPVWFPFAFGTTGLIGGRLARTIVGIWENANPSPTRSD